MGGEGRNTQQHGWDDPKVEEEEIAQKMRSQEAPPLGDFDSTKTRIIRGRKFTRGGPDRGRGIDGK